MHAWFTSMRQVQFVHYDHKNSGKMTVMSAFRVGVLFAVLLCFVPWNTMLLMSFS